MLAPSDLVYCISHYPDEDLRLHVCLASHDLSDTGEGYCHTLEAIEDDLYKLLPPILEKSGLDWDNYGEFSWGIDPYPSKKQIASFKSYMKNLGFGYEPRLNPDDDMIVD
jgi:hypothetical protein